MVDIEPTVYNYIVLSFKAIGSMSCCSPIDEGSVRVLFHPYKVLKKFRGTKASCYHNISWGETHTISIGTATIKQTTQFTTPQNARLLRAVPMPPVFLFAVMSPDIL